MTHQEYVREKLDSIHSQVEKTNGRVQSLERWRAAMAGGMTVLSIIVIPIVLYVIRTWIS